MNKAEKLTLLAEKVSACTKCQELAMTRKQTVFGNGDINSRILVCAESPGSAENDTGQPLVGPAGQEWNKLLAMVGLERSQIYHMNILKCRPPNNRRPKEEECANCSPFFKMQIKIINPRYIICLGGVAAQNLLGVDAPMREMRGRWFDYIDEPVKSLAVATYHPSYLLRERNPELYQQVLSDIGMIATSLSVINYDAVEGTNEDETY